jgi:hypothetical protein
MKISIVITLIITIAVFSFVSGYSISVHNKMEPASSVAGQTNMSNRGTATAGEYVPEPSGGYGSPSSEKAPNNSGSAAGYGTPSPGYGQ